MLKNFRRMTHPTKIFLHRNLFSNTFTCEKDREKAYVNTLGDHNLWTDTYDEMDNQDVYVCVCVCVCVFAMLVSVRD